jgi:microcompartment protein CcmL/EutN
MYRAIGMIELTSIAQGILCADEMVKVANVELVFAKATCPGKYIILLAGEVADVERAVSTGKEQAGNQLVDSFVIPNVHQSVLPAISFSGQLGAIKAVGVIETYSVATCIEAADAAVKAAAVEPVKLHIAFGIGGRSYVVLNGEVADVQAAVETGADLAAAHGMLMGKVVIPRPDKQVIDSMLA